MQLGEGSGEGSKEELEEGSEDELGKGLEKELGEGSEEVSEGLQEGSEVIGPTLGSWIPVSCS